MTILLTDVALDSDLEDKIGSEELARLIPDGWSDATNARAQALEDALASLSRRTPPIYENAVQDPAELKRAVIYGALQNLYAESMHGEGDAFDIKRKMWGKRFVAEIMGMHITVANARRGPSMSIGIERR